MRPVVLWGRVETTNYGIMLKRMKHADAGTLGKLGTLLKQLRKLPLKEKSPGVFYFRSRAFLHFHDDEAGIFADIKLADQWERYCVSKRDAQAAMLARASRFTRGAG